MVNNPQFDNLPPIKLIHIQDQAPSTLQGESRSRAGKIAATTDIRWVKVLEFLRSNNLAPNSRKLYERELKRFLAWSELHIMSYAHVILRYIKNISVMKYRLMQVNRFPKAASMQELRLSKAFSNGCVTRILKLFLLIRHWG